MSPMVATSIPISSPGPSPPIANSGPPIAVAPPFIPMWQVAVFDGVP